MATETKKSRKKSKQKVEEQSSSPIGAVRTYFSEVRTELDKVTWPTREEVMRLTRIVIIVTIIAAAMLGGLSAILTFFIEFGLDQPWVFIIAFAAIVGGTIYMFRRGGQKSSY